MTTKTETDRWYDIGYRDGWNGAMAAPPKNYLKASAYFEGFANGQKAAAA